MPITVKARKDESTDSMIRKFKKKTLMENVVEEARKRQFHASPSVIKKEKMNEIRRKKYVERMQKLAGRAK